MGRDTRRSGRRLGGGMPVSQETGGPTPTSQKESTGENKHGLRSQTQVHADIAITAGEEVISRIEAFLEDPSWQTLTRLEAGLTVGNSLLQRARGIIPGSSQPRPEVGQATDKQLPSGPETKKPKGQRGKES